MALKNQLLAQVMFLLCMLFPLCSSATVHDGSFMEGRVKGFCCEREFEAPEAFEKVYADFSTILSMPSGVFLKHDNGDLEPMRALLADCHGMYLMRIYTQCPQCGRCYGGKYASNEFKCPLYEQEILPRMWSAPR